MTKISTPEPLANANRIHPAVMSTGSRNSRVTKARKPLSASEARQRQLDREEMQSLLAKLKQLVPSIPKNRKMSKLEIIQHVIDYIFDLQVALESHPISAAAAAEFMNSTLSSISPYSSPSSSVSSALAAAAAALAASPIVADDAPVACCDASQMSQTQQRIPGNNRQPLASIML